MCLAHAPTNAHRRDEARLKQPLSDLFFTKRIALYILLNRSDEPGDLPAIVGIQSLLACGGARQ